MIRLFRVFVPIGTATLLISEVLLITAAFVLASYLILPVDATAYLLYDGGLRNMGLVILTLLVGLYFHDLYTEIYVKSKIVLAQQLCIVLGIAFLVQGLLSYVNGGLRVPIRLMLGGSLLAVASMYWWRIFFSAYALRVVGRDRLLLVGDSPLLELIAAHIAEHPEHGLQVTGYVDNCSPEDAPRTGGKLLGSVQDLRPIVEATRPTRIVVGMSERRNRMPVGELLDLRFAGHMIEEAATAYEQVCGRVSIKDLRPSQLIYSGELGPVRSSLFYQTVFNLAMAAVGALAALPLMLLTALAVRMSSAGPILYRQVRVGMDGVPFTLYKFRSMRVNAEEGTGAVWAQRDDPRVTRVGRIIRKIRFDELPQLFNVLRGEMSIVGPRPERPEFVRVLSEQIPYYRQRHCVRPGITGWAQISYKYGDTLEDTITKLEYDLYYIKNMALSMDTYIIFHTAKAMLLSRGAQ
jgi:sugar transferase (PEP-CTERM system associated)